LYDPTQRAIISPRGEIFHSINSQSIDEILQAPNIVPTHPFSHEILIETYQKMDFTKRAQLLELFLVVDSPLPKTNPPYDSSIFTDRTKEITTILYYLLSYYSHQYLDEAIIGFLSIFSSSPKPTVLFKFFQFLAKAIHEQFFQFNTEEVFKYAFVLVYLFINFQGDKFPFTLQKLDEEGKKQSMIFWTSMGMKEKEEFLNKQFIDFLFIQPLLL